jgi:large subunit ribosomal protein L28
MASTSSAVIRRVLSRRTNPAILPIPSRTSGNNVPKSLHKTRRTWHPNTARVDWAVSLPAAFRAEGDVLAQASGSTGASSGGEKRVVMKGVKMQIRRRKDVEKAGGIEGLLVSRLSPTASYVRQSV